MTKARNKTEKVIIVSSLLILLISTREIACGQNVNQSAGKYLYKSQFFYECLDLKENGEFSYEVDHELSQQKVTGNWQLRNNEIVLDSYPQHDKIMVYESRNSQRNGELIYVYDKKELPINYSLMAITNNNDTVKLKNQFRHSFLKVKIKSFYITDSEGIISPVYKISGTRTNEFKVLFETRRVFENEHWEIRSGVIFPKDASGKIESFSLKKN